MENMPWKICKKKSFNFFCILLMVYLPQSFDYFHHNFFMHVQWFSWHNNYVCKFNGIPGVIFLWIKWLSYDIIPVNLMIFTTWKIRISRINLKHMKNNVRFTIRNGIYCIIFASEKDRVFNYFFTIFMAWYSCKFNDFHQMKFSTFMH